MIFVSSSCVKAKYIGEAVRILVNLGYKNIELSGGTAYYDGLTEDLTELKERYKLNYLIHNYFPPPERDFVLNLASLDEKIFEVSVNHCIKAINLGCILGSKKFSVHAGFYMEPQVSMLGKTINNDTLAKREKAIERFCQGYELIFEECKKCGIELYVENHVFSRDNFISFKGENPLMLTSFCDYQELRERIEFKLLLDVGHLKVSANTLNNSLCDEFEKFWQVTDYVHISDNDGLADINFGLEEGELLTLIEKNGIKDKTVTLEIYNDIDIMQKTFKRLEKCYYG